MSHKLMGASHHHRGLPTHSTGDDAFDHLFAWLGDGSTQVRDETTVAIQSTRLAAIANAAGGMPHVAEVELVTWSRDSTELTGLVIRHNGRARLVRDVPKNWKRMTWAQLEPLFHAGRPLLG